MPTMRTGSLRFTALVVVLVVVGVAAVELVGRGLRWERAGRRLPGREVSWIWAPGWSREPARAEAFVAVRRFDLPARPEAARLLVLADEEYSVAVNGTWVGSGRYRSGLIWDAYDVADRLRRGGNRIDVEARSTRGIGGVLVCLDLGAPGGGCAVASDGSWRVGPGPPPRSPSLAGWGDAPIVWGVPPAGRWPVPDGVRERPTASRCVDRSRAFAPDHVVSRGFVAIDGGASVVPVWRLRWSHQLRGYLFLQPKTPGREVGILRLSDARRVLPGAREIEVVVPEGGVWVSPEALEVRTIDVVGFAEPPTARIHPLRDGCEALLSPPPARPDGLLGLVPPDSGSAVEHELRREFERGPGL